MHSPPNGLSPFRAGMGMNGWRVGVYERMAMPQPAVVQKGCWFCDTPLTGANASEEHVFPQWLQKELGLEKVAITPTWHAEPLGALLDERKHTWGTLVAGRICRSCNNGWMSNLESEAMPLLLPLIRGDRLVSELSAEEARQIAVWATKTVLALSAAVQEKRAPATQYHALCASPTSVPAGIHVLAMQHALTSSAHYIIDATWQESRKCAIAEEAAAVSKHSYKACLQLGQLLLLVVWWPLGPEWVLSGEEGRYQVLAPADAKLVWHPPPAEFSEEVQNAVGPELLAQLETDSSAYCLGLTMSIKVFHRGDLPDWLLAEFGLEPLAS
jgi:hypothetical protein